MTTKAENPRSDSALDCSQLSPFAVVGPGWASFDLSAEKGEARLIPVIGTMAELYGRARILNTLVVDRCGTAESSLQALETVRLTPAGHLV